MSKYIIPNKIGSKKKKKNNLGYVWIKSDKMIK